MISQAVILLGGKGTRLTPLYPDRPKALVPVASRPFLQWQIEWLARNDVTDLHLAAGHMATPLQEWITAHDPSATLSVEPTPLGTAGGLKFVEPFLRSDPFLVLNGDSLLPALDFQALEKAHRNNSKTWITIAVTPIEESGRYGTVEFDTAGHVTVFREKAEHRAGWINGGIYLMSRQALSDIQPGRPVSIETDLFPTLVQQGRIQALTTTPPLLDMGTPDGLSAMEDWLYRHPVG